MSRRGLSLFLQHPVNCALFSCSPPALSCAWVRLLGRLWFRAHPGEKDRYTGPLREILGGRRPSADSVDVTASRMLLGVMEHYYEKLLTAYWGFSRMRRMLLERVTFVHGDLLDTGLDLGRGVILTTAHFGAVEFLPAALAFRGYPVTMAVRYGTPRLK